MPSIVQHVSASTTFFATRLTTCQAVFHAMETQIEYGHYQDSC